MRTPTRMELVLLLSFAALAAIAVFGPPVANPAHAHAFADDRTLWGIPHACDVLSNVPFLVAGWYGLAMTRRVHPSFWSVAQRLCAQVFFVGLVLTAVGSSWYHLAPDDLGLAIDRAAMAVAFAGLLGLAVAGRVSARAGRALLVAVLLLGPASVLAWLRTGNVLPWAVVQFGGMLLLLGVLAGGRACGDTLPVRWGVVLLAYAVAKLFEAGDHVIFAASGELLSGHTLKHVAAAFAAAPVIAALAARTARQNEPETVVHAA